MKNDLMKLFETQKIDLEIDQLNKYKIIYPQQIEQLRQEIDLLKKNLEETRCSIVENEKNKFILEQEIASEREILAEKEKRLLETKTNKEYQAVQHEIEMARQRLDSLETEELVVMTELDRLSQVRDEFEKKEVEVGQTNTVKIDEITEKFKSIESDLSVLEHKHKLAIQDVNSHTLSIYSRLRRGKDGVAIAIVDQVKHSCRGCFKQLPPQKVMEIRRGDKIYFCENCGRILIWNHENSQ